MTCDSYCSNKFIVTYISIIHFSHDGISTTFLSGGVTKYP